MHVKLVVKSNVIIWRLKFLIHRSIRSLFGFRFVRTVYDLQLTAHDSRLSIEIRFRNTSSVPSFFWFMVLALSCSVFQPFGLNYYI